MRPVTFAVAALVLPLAACSTATKAPQRARATTPSDAAEVVIHDYKFVPPTLTVPVGTTVTWVNQDIAPHTATHRSFGDEPFDSGNIEVTQIFRHRFRTPGTYDYLCVLHQGMRGTIVVQ